MNKQEIEALKLTSEENSQLNDFIGKAVRNNYTFGVLTQRVAVTPKMGVQELYNQSEETLITYAGLLDKNIKGHITNFDPRARGEKAYMIGRVKGSDLLNILQLIIKEKAYNTEVENAILRKENIKAKLEDLKTPEEKRKELEAELSLLEA
jgi:hypothetical protein